MSTGRHTGAGLEDLWGTVPEGDNLVRVGTDGDLKGARKPKVGNLQLALTVDQQVLRLQVAVHDAARVADGHTLEELVHVGLDQRHAHAIRPAGIHVFFEVFVEPLENEVEAVLGVLYVHQVDDVGVRELLQKGDLTERRGRDAFVLDLETDLLECDHAACRLSDEARRFVDDLMGT